MSFYGFKLVTIQYHQKFHRIGFIIYRMTAAAKKLLHSALLPLGNWIFENRLIKNEKYVKTAPKFPISFYKNPYAVKTCL